MNVPGLYWQNDQPDEYITAIIGLAPKRWGRMDFASRIAIVEVGHILSEATLLNEQKRLPPEIRAGLIVGTRRGSLSTDLQFLKSMADDPKHASPLLFSYTLPNIPLAETAGQYQIKGPVYSMYSENPYDEAVEEGRRMLQCDPSISFIIAGALDYYHQENGLKPANPQIKANFTIIR